MSAQAIDVSSKRVSWGLGVVPSIKIEHADLGVNDIELQVLKISGWPALAPAVYGADQLRRAQIDPSTLYGVLDNATKAVHLELMRNPYLNKLISGKVCDGYIVYLHNIRAIHEVLQRIQSQIPESALVFKFIIKDLWRLTAIDIDLTTWSQIFSDSDDGSDPVTLVTKEYAAHLEALLKEDPNLLVAHLWTFYGTLLSGGQIIGASVKKAYGEKYQLMEIEKNPHDGIALFDFPFLVSQRTKEATTEEAFRKGLREDIRAYKDNVWHPAMNAVLDGVPSDARERFKKRCGEEANISFRVVEGFINQSPVLSKCVMPSPV